jgi:hypothetical protein
MTDRLTREDVEKLREGTTPGPWMREAQGVYRSRGYGLVAHLKDHEWGRDWPTLERDGNLIAAAPSLAATALALMDERDNMAMTALMSDGEAQRAWEAQKAAEGEVAALKAEVERLRGLVLNAYIEGYVEAGGHWMADSGWEQSESSGALQENRPGPHPDFKHYDREMRVDVQYFINPVRKGPDREDKT